ncbi:MAG: hypothetical protein V4787_17175 [Pseudomonadota bacterium]
MKTFHAALAVSAAIVWGLIYIAARSMLASGSAPQPVALRFMVVLIALGGALGLLVVGLLVAHARSRIARSRGIGSTRAPDAAAAR